MLEFLTKPFIVKKKFGNKKSLYADIEHQRANEFEAIKEIIELVTHIVSHALKKLSRAKTKEALQSQLIGKVAVAFFRCQFCT